MDAYFEFLFFYFIFYSSHRQLKILGLYLVTKNVVISYFISRCSLGVFLWLQKISRHFNIKSSFQLTQIKIKYTYNQITLGFITSQNMLVKKRQNLTFIPLHLGQFSLQPLMFQTFHFDCKFGLVFLLFLWQISLETFIKKD